MSRLQFTMWFLLGALVAQIVLVQLGAYGPTLGEQISRSICHSWNGAWDTKSNTCILP